MDQPVRLRQFLPDGFTATGKQQADTGQKYVDKAFRHSDRYPISGQRYIIFLPLGDSPMFLSVSSIPFPAQKEKVYLREETKGLSMLHLKWNDLLIGFTISILISIFVNFALLIHKYEFVIGNQTMGIQPPDRIMYYLLIWFFVFSLILFIANRLIYKLGERVFRKKEYKRISLVCVTCLGIAYGMFRLSPILYNTIVTEWLGEEDNPHDTRDITIRIDREHMATRTIRHPEYREIPRPPRPFTQPNSFLTEHLFVFLTVMLSALLIRLLSSKQQMKLEYEQLKTEKLQNSYNALMGQINPHFFFNSLNGLNALIQSGEKQQTLAYLDELSNVFRYILQSNKKELVTLAEELQFVKAYTYLLSVRYEGKLFFSIQVATPYFLWYVPILSVLPLIENAVKHNVISKQYPLQIDIYTTAEGCLVISNKIHSKSEDSKGSGIGLKNLWGRYRMLTGKDIQISNRKEYFKVALPLLNKSIHA